MFSRMKKWYKVGEKGEEDRKQRQYVNLEVNRPIRYTVGGIPN